ncbi:hypothetical protein TWF102_006332 [Orbilia oligospora]|uniref:Uncharacterized protein n=1 Tax=Orbilia oligospora TaxID=2813651 RepID=A0A7C8NDG1_ORBOL|nr:hypothetical protein TWF103_000880 [Orbilia oligospora]KAF3092931.1 hypothetical protein TWF706_008908 [Orbilia oligospora]KAF3097351.1 hypothetical protein TWF102_006332 [Orbilia oligospora]KAF3135593.1 hypothetical protein TWF594_008325 [Orbilia oligospora]
MMSIRFSVGSECIHVERVQCDNFALVMNWKRAVNVSRPVKRRTFSKQVLHQITFRQSTKIQKKIDGRKSQKKKKRNDERYRTHGNGMRAVIDEKKQKLIHTVWCRCLARSGLLTHMQHTR